MSNDLNDLPASPEHPIYTLVADAADPNHYIITVFDERHTDVLCEGLTTKTGGWLICRLADRPPYAI
jgi:hypothetical protein